MQRRYLLIAFSVALLAMLTTMVSADEQVVVNESDGQILLDSSSDFIDLTVKPKIAYVFTRQNEVSFMEKVASRPEISSQMNISVYLGVSYADLSFKLSDKDMVVMAGLDPFVTAKITPEVNAAKANGAHIVSNGASLLEHGLHTVNTSDPEYAPIDAYLKYSSESNFHGLSTFIGNKFFGTNYSLEDPISRPLYGIYHPSAPMIYGDIDSYLAWYGAIGVYDPAKPSIGVFIDSFTFMERDVPLLDMLVRDIEDKECNAIVATYSFRDNQSINYMCIDNRPIIDSLIVISRGGRMHYSNNSQGIADFEFLNVTVMNGIRLFAGVSVEDWESSIHGVAPDQRYQVAFSELDGIIEPIVISAKATDNVTNLEYNRPIDYQIDWMTSRAKAWAQLHRKANSEKRILVPYFNPEGGKANIGADIDYYLDAQASLASLLKAMQTRSYDTGTEALPDAAGLAAMMVKGGHNVGNWAPGELEKAVSGGSVILVPESQYLQWFSELPQEKRDEMTAMWGPAPGDIMVFENSTGRYLVIPVLRFGNILLAPEPQNGWSSSTQAMYNNASYPPTHQCLAFYRYMATEYQADAIMSIFSSIELMPGKECGLSANDWGAILMQDLPHIHVLPMDAQGVFDKRRANMLVIDFMTPTLVPAGLYGDLADLQQDIDLFIQVSDSAVRDVQRQNILNRTRELHLDHDLNVSLDAIKDDHVLEDTFIERLGKHLHGLKTAFMPYGSHILGEVPEGESLIMLIKGMLGPDFVKHVVDAGGNEDMAVQLLNRTISDSLSIQDAQIAVLGNTSSDVEADLELALDYLQRIEASKQEISKILDALEGKYITPGPSGDPIRNPDALPTGRDLYTFDDRLIPTKAAWTIGSSLAEDLIQVRMAETGKYPEKIAFVLWSVETTRNHGVMESEILKLLGVEPIYNAKTNRVTGLKLISSEELGRPRIDVLIVTSGLYRDVYSSKIQLLDEAVRMASEANDTAYPNYVKAHSQVNYQTLVDSGIEDTLAHELSVSRIFSPAPGAYTPGIQEAIMSDTWEDTNKIADLYIDRMGHLYGKDTWGGQYSDVFRMGLSGVDSAVFSRTSNLFGVLDHSMVAAYFGGLSMAVEKAGGARPAMYINDLSSDAKLDTLGQFLATDLRSRYLNPKWVQGMMNNGYDGTRYMDSVFGVMRTWDVTTPEVVSNEMWDELYETYFRDKHNTGVTEHLKSTNPYAYSSMAATALESVRTKHWTASDEVVQDLVKEYVETVVDNGVTCCHHTCGNPSLTGFVQGIMSMPGLVNEQTRAEFNRIMQEATQTNTPAPVVQESSGSRSSSNSTRLEIKEVDRAGVGEDLSIPAPDVVPRSVPDNFVEGYEMVKEEHAPAQSSNFSFSGSDIIASILVLACVGAVYMGFRRRKG